MTITAVPGEWSDVDGSPTVVGQWVDQDEVAVAAPNVAALTVPADAEQDSDGGYVWKETATQAGASSTQYSPFYVQVVSPITEAPIWNGFTTPITGSATPGETLTKPVFDWYSGNGFTTAGQWVKNGTLTGVATSTYSATVEGDSVQWQETATDEFDNVSDPALSSPVLVSAVVGAAIPALRNGIDARIDGLAGGSLNMKRFSVKNHATSTYVWNPDLWCYDVRDQLTGVVAQKNGGIISDRPEDYGGVLITPRHVLYCNHAHPWAANTRSASATDAQACNVRFVLGDNTVVNAVQIHQATVAGVDMCVAVLDRDVQDLGVSVMPISPFDSSYWNAIINQGTPALPVFSISQGHNAVNTPWSQPVADYPYPDHDVLCYIHDFHNQKINASWPEPPITTYRPFNYSAYDGDSGTGAFLLHDDTVYLFQITVGLWGGPKVADYVSNLNSAISQADANAIALGRLAAPTGFTIAKASLPVFGFNPLTTAAGEPITLSGSYTLTRNI
jgi:hypothetical protein